MNIPFGQIRPINPETIEVHSEIFALDLEKWIKEDSFARKGAGSRIRQAFENNKTALDLSDFLLSEIPSCIGELSGLIQLNLSGNRLKTLPPEVGRLSQLEALNLNGNNLEFFPKEIGALSRLKILYLQVQKSHFSPLLQQIGGLSQLKILDLSGNRLKEVPPKLLELTQLIALCLADNNLTSLPPEIGNLLQLKILNLQENALTSLPSEISKLPCLEILDLSKNHLKSFPLELLELPRLTKLSLAENSLESLPNEIEKLFHIEILDLQKSKLTSLPPQIGKLSQLTELYLVDNHLTSLPPEIEELSKLTKLYLNWNALKTLPPEIGELSQLKTLCLQKNNLTVLPEEIGKLTQLLTFSLHGNNLKILPKEIGLLSQLTELDLSKNKLTSLPKEIRGLHQLCELSLDENDFKFLPSELGRLKNLKGLNVSGNKELKELPLNLGQISILTNIKVEETGISEEEHDALLNLCETFRLGGLFGFELFSPGIFFHRLKLWKLKSKGEFSSLKALNFASEKIGSLNLWLTRLENIEDLNCRVQTPLAKIVCQMLLDASKNEDFASLFFSQIEANLESCQDRASMALNEIFTSWKLANLENSATTEEKLQIMVSGAKTNALRAALSQSIAEHQRAEGKVLEEAVEIYLYYEIILREKLNLLSITENMTYELIGRVNWIREEDLINKVNETYLDHLIENNFFEKILQDDEEYQDALQKDMKSFEEAIEKLFDEKPQNVEEDSKESLDWITETNTLMRERELALAALKKQWVQKTLGNA